MNGLMPILCIIGRMVFLSHGIAITLIDTMKDVFYFSSIAEMEVLVPIVRVRVNMTTTLPEISMLL